jgi:hypothetical protein
MAKIHPAYEEGRRKYWTRHDAHLWVRHDAWRFMPPGAPIYAGHDVVKYGEPNFGRPTADEPWRAQAEEEAFQREVAELRAALAELKAEIEAGTQRQWREAKRLSDLRWQRFVQKIKAGFNPDQPRVPAGNPDGGQWTSDGGQTDRESQGGRVVLAQLSSITDGDGRPYYQPGGHHEAARGVYTKWNLPPKTRWVFDQATTGRIPPMLLRTAPDGAPVGHFWDGPNGAHGRYNEAVQELSERFFQRHNIRPEQMTPDHARSFLKEIRESQDPRIRDYNNAMRLLRRLFPLRPGRGTE